MTDAADFRDQFPVLQQLAYLNAGTEGPVPARASEAVHARMDLEVNQGRCGRPYFEGLRELAARAREGYARALGAEPTEVALTGSTTDGVNTVLGGLDLGPGDEVLTSDEEHPGLLAPIGRARALKGISIRIVPFRELAGEVSPATKLIACSHVSWASGLIVDVPALVATGVPVLLDAAQALGAIPIDVRALGVDYYAGSGQKWMCGPEGSGALYVREDRLDDVFIPWPGYGSLADPHEPLEMNPAPGTPRFDHGFPSGLRSAWTVASIEVFEEAGWDWVHARAAMLAQTLATELTERGLDVFERGPSTLVSWKVADAQAEVERLAAAGFIVRSIPAFDSVRASVGAWTSEEELARLVDVAAAGA